MKLITIAILIYQAMSIAFLLTKNKEACFHIKQKGKYQIQFIISGAQQADLYKCTIYAGNNPIQNINSTTQYTTIVQFINDTNNRICFESYGKQTKHVSLDIMSAQDPLKDHFSVKQQQQTHLKMFKAFQQLQKVYRDQHMFIQRSAIYANILGNVQFKILFILFFKILVAIILGGYQLLLIKQIVASKSYGYSLPPGVQQDDSQDDFD